MFAWSEGFPSTAYFSLCALGKVSVANSCFRRDPARLAPAFHEGKQPISGHRCWLARGLPGTSLGPPWGLPGDSPGHPWGLPAGETEGPIATWEPLREGAGSLPRASGHCPGVPGHCLGRRAMTLGPGHYIGPYIGPLYSPYTGLSSQRKPSPSPRASWSPRLWAPQRTGRPPTSGCNNSGAQFRHSAEGSQTINPKGGSGASKWATSENTLRCRGCTPAE